MRPFHTVLGKIYSTNKLIILKKKNNITIAVIRGQSAAVM